MDIKELEKIIKSGESLTVEFKSWIKTASKKESVTLAVNELAALANTKGGVLLFGIEDNGDVTGCTNYDIQNFIEAIYDKTRPPLFVECEVIEYQGKDVIVLSVETDGQTYATTDGRCLKRLGKNSKPFYPEEMSNRYSSLQTPDFSGQVIVDSRIDDIDSLEVYKLKERLKLRDTTSTLAEMEDMAFLRDLSLVKRADGEEKLTIAGLLFVGKESAINRMLPQSEVIYLHYGEDNLEEYDSRLDMKLPIVSVIDKLTDKIQGTNKLMNLQVGLFRLEIEDFSLKVFQEALLNAIAHRDYQSTGAIYVKHYPDRIVIENPGGFPEGITVDNIITHPSAPRNKLIAETLQRLKYVQRTGQGVDIIYRELISMGKPLPKYNEFPDAISLTLYSNTNDTSFVRFIAEEQEKQQKVFSLQELMILNYLVSNKRIKINEAKKLTQCTIDETRKSCNALIQRGLIELSGKEYMLTAKSYDALKMDIEYFKDQSVQYIKAKNLVLEYLRVNKFITNPIVRELCSFTKQQARVLIDRMRDEDILKKVGRGRGTKYQLKN